jgi:hypothetical protein
VSAIGREASGVALAVLGLAMLEVGASMGGGWLALLLVNGPLLVAGGFVLMRHDRDQGEPDQ